MENTKMYQVCKPEECDNVPLMGVQIGDQTHNYCCQKGFERTLAEFKQHMAKRSKESTTLKLMDSRNILMAAAFEVRILLMEIFDQGGPAQLPFILATLDKAIEKSEIRLGTAEPTSLMQAMAVVYEQSIRKVGEALELLINTKMDQETYEQLVPVETALLKALGQYKEEPQEKEAQS